MSSASIAGMTRNDAVMRSMSRHVCTNGELTASVERFFGEYQADRQRAIEEGVTIDIAMCAGMAAWFADWKQQQALQEARKIERADAATERRGNGG